MKPIKKILIVGGGTSGLVAALILQKRFSKIKIHLVKYNLFNLIIINIILEKLKYLNISNSNINWLIR